MAKVGGYDICTHIYIYMYIYMYIYIDIDINIFVYVYKQMNEYIYNIYANVYVSWFVHVFENLEPYGYETDRRSATSAVLVVSTARVSPPFCNTVPLKGA